MTHKTDYDTYLTMAYTGIEYDAHTPVLRPVVVLDTHAPARVPLVWPRINGDDPPLVGKPVRVLERHLARQLQLRVIHPASDRRGRAESCFGWVHIRIAESKYQEGWDVYKEAVVEDRFGYRRF